MGMTPYSFLSESHMKNRPRNRHTIGQFGDLPLDCQGLAAAIVSIGFTIK
jgi:hypothetical protein